MAAFEADVFEGLHGSAVALLVAGGSVGGAAQREAFEELRRRREALARPFSFRGREETLDLQQLARHIASEKPRLASEPLIRAVDDVSRTLRLHQSDACSLVERTLDLGVGLRDVVRKCAAIYYRECHFQALCVNDMAQGLSQSPPDKRSVAFFGLLGGKRFVMSLFESLGLLLRDMTGERAGDPDFLSHVGTMIQLVVETLLAYFATFQASAEETEQVLSLLPHVVVSQHAPVGQGFTISDLDLVLREDHNDVSLKLCFVLVCMCQAQPLGDPKLDSTKLGEKTPWELRLEDLQAAPGGELLSGPFGSKVRNGNYWNEESQLGQFLCFAISGVMLDDDHSLRGSYVRWHIFHFLLHEVLMSGLVNAETCTGTLLLRCLHELLQQALLPVGRRWVAIRKLDVQAVSMRLLAPDALQSSALQVLNWLCRVHPPACETFRDIALHCTDTFHLTTHQHGQHIHSSGHLMHRAPLSAPGGMLQRHIPPWWESGQQVTTHAATLGTNSLVVGESMHDNTALYAEILDLIATVCSRGSMNNAHLVCQKIHSHSNQWFNWGFLVDTLVQHARAQSNHHGQLLGLGTVAGGHMPDPEAPVVVSICRLISGACGSRLLLVQPVQQPFAQSLQQGLAQGGSYTESLANLLIELLLSHPDATVKSASLGALGHLDLPQQAARGVLMSLLAAAPRFVTLIDMFDGAVAIELLAASLRLIQQVAIGRGRYSLDLQPLTQIVINHVLLKTLTDATMFRSASRYWRLAALSLRWLRMVLRGPMPLSSSSALNSVLILPYADCETTANDVAMRCAAGNATAYAFRCLLSLDSQVFARVCYLATLHGRSMDGLADRRRSGTARPSMEQCVRAGIDVLRLLFQRDVLFCQLHAEHSSSNIHHMQAGDMCLEDGPIQQAHHLLLAEFAFTYPPDMSVAARMGMTSAHMMANPFSWNRQPEIPRHQHMELSEAATGTRRRNPSYLSLLTELVGVRAEPEISRTALYLFMQCAVREPLRVLRLLQLEPWRLQALSIALHDRLLESDTANPAAEASQALGASRREWDERRNMQFTYEAVDMDTFPDALSHLDVSSFETGLPICKSVDRLHQVAEDAIVQAADISVWARGSLCEGQVAASLRSCSASDSARFDAGYLRGFDIPRDWLSAGTSGLAASVEAQGGTGFLLPPLANLHSTSCRQIALWLFSLLLSGSAPDDLASAAPRLAQLLLGLNPDVPGLQGAVDVDPVRASNPSALDAVMALLENPPSLPAWLESGSPRPSCSRALLPEEPSLAGLEQALQDHAAYESALGVLLSLLALPAVRDVMLRYMCHAWASRYDVLRTLLGVPWSSVAPAMRRLLLSEAALALQGLAWEMRLVWPSGRPPRVAESSHLDIVGQQKLEMKLVVSEHLQEVVSSLVAPVAGGGHSMNAHAQVPFLVSAALRLAEACENLDWQSGATSSRFFQDATQERERTACCLCLVPALGAGGGLARSLELKDPYLFLRLSGFSALQAPHEADQRALSETLRLIGSTNEVRCTAHFTEVACRALSTFVFAAMHHLTGRPPVIGGTAAPQDPRAQAARAHLEALLPALASEVKAGEAAVPRRLELLSGLAAAFTAAMLERSEAPPLAFVRQVYELLAKALTQPLAISKEARRSLQESLLLLLQRLLPDLLVEASKGVQPAALETEDLTKLQQLTALLMQAAVVEADALAEAGACGSLASSQPAVSLPVLGALLVRIPRPQLGEAFHGCRVWQQLAGLISGSFPRGPSDTTSPARLLHRFQAAALAAVLCQAPGAANAFFEAGGLGAVLAPEMLSGCHLRLAPPGLHALDTIHPAALVLVLQVLVAMLGVLPTHTLVLQNALAWLEKHQQPLLEVLQWVARLPLAVFAEPRPRQRVAAGPLVGGATQSEAVITAVATRGRGAAGQTGHEALLVLCHSCDASDAIDSSVDAAAPALSGRRSLAGMAASAASSAAGVLQTEHCGEAVALCHRCVALTAELWSLLNASAQKRNTFRTAVLQATAWGWPNAASHSHILNAAGQPLIPRTDHTGLPTLAAVELQTDEQDPLKELFLRLEATALPSILPDLLAKAAAVSSLPLPGTTPDAVTRALDLAPTPGTGLAPEVLNPSEATSLVICSHILRLWRHDAVARQIRQLAARGSAQDQAHLGGALSSGAWLGWQQTAGMAAAPFSTLPASALPGGAEANGFSAELLVKVKVRASVLSTVFVHVCDGLLALSLAGPPRPVLQLGGEGQPLESQRVEALAPGHGQQLRFEGSAREFKQRLLLVEVSLHLLCVHLSVMAAASDLGIVAVAGPMAAAPALSLAAPRAALVRQYLRVLGEFTRASGGAVALAEAKAVDAPTGHHSAGRVLATANLAFTAAAAAAAEKLVAQLQLQQGGL
eukprot:TRINITY_DN89232_c0_g1_i1.p1 TRINITY_DN89232_c0_g1~~TRINITY_DN89232_c0_g1_i1.p1  ORF type:complete len:2389 (+),score=416.49 TRINITY_DN89232_c0_g1_i1:30-7169(+)